MLFNFIGTFLGINKSVNKKLIKLNIMDIKFNYSTNPSGLSERLRPLLSSLTNLNFLRTKKTFKNPFSSFSNGTEFSPTPSNEKKSTEQIQELNSCLREMNPKQMKVFVLKTFEDLSTNDICSRLNITENDFWKYIGAAREEISERLFAN